MKNIDHADYLKEQIIVKGVSMLCVDRRNRKMSACVSLCFASAVSLLFFLSAVEAENKMSLPESMKEAQLVGMDTCVSCHEKESKEYKLSTHSRIKVSKDQEGVSESCEMCHGPGSVHVANGGGKGNIINPNKNPDICFSCHMDKKMEFRQPFHHPVLEGKMSCSDCHNLHGPEARPWSATSMEDINETCFKCHKDIRGPFPWEHEALREGCTTCHKVHGSITDKMLVVRDANLCLRCHIQTDFPGIGDRNHATNLTQGTCWSAGCHTAVHGSYYDRHLRE